MYASFAQYINDSSILSQSELETVKPCIRFAPSPNGYLHLGHAYAALFAYRAAKALGGTFIAVSYTHLTLPTIA